MSRSPRRTMAGEAEDNAKRPEKCTPSPNDYTTNKLKFLPSLGRGGAASLAQKAPRITSIAEAAGSITPGPEYKIPHHSVFQKRTLSVKFESKTTDRLSVIKRTEQTDFFETSNAAKKTVA